MATFNDVHNLAKTMTQSIDENHPPGIAHCIDLVLQVAQKEAAPFDRCFEALQELAQKQGLDTGDQD